MHLLPLGGLLRPFAVAVSQIIYNMLRHKPATSGFLAAAKAANVGTLIRLPFASGLLTGKIDAAYIDGLEDSDHRKFNRAGEFFVRALLSVIPLLLGSDAPALRLAVKRRNVVGAWRAPGGRGAAGCGKARHCRRRRQGAR